MKRERKPETFVKVPSFPGGNKAMAAFIQKNLKYPKDAVENRIEGVVVVDISFNKLGEVVSAKVRSGLGYGCDEEALRVAKMLRFEKATSNKGRITFHKSINFRFKLPQPKQMAVSYQFTSKKSESSNTYSYTIKI